MNDNTNLQRNAKIIKGSIRLKVHPDLKPVQLFGITYNSYDHTAFSPRPRIKENTHKKDEDVGATAASLKPRH